MIYAVSTRKVLDESKLLVLSQLANRVTPLCRVACLPPQIALKKVVASLAAQTPFTLYIQMSFGKLLFFKKDLRLWFKTCMRW